jgi:glutamate carboxypeptidase
MDTVFPADTHFTWWREENEHVNGPGVIDMKGGLVVGIFALLAIAENALMDGLPVKFIFNSEEEVGSPVSRFMIAEEARKSAMAFVLECGGLQGEVVTGRKGRMGLRLEVSGRAGHAAGPGNKASAILSLAQHIISLETVNDRQPGVSVNVGQIQGGVGPNSVPDHAWAAVDVRFADRDGERWFQEQLDAIVHSRTMRGTSTKVVVVSSRPLMEQSRGNRSLFRVAAAQAEALKIPILEEFRSGVSDANIIAAQGIPVLDGMGPLGDLDHSDREYLIVDSLVERCQLLAMTIIECWRRFQTWGHIFDL